MARVMPGLEEQPRDMSIIPKTSQNADECKMHFVANLFLFFFGGNFFKISSSVLVCKTIARFIIYELDLPYTSCPQLIDL